MQPQTLIMIALMVVAFYFLIMRPQKKRQQAIAKTQSELGPGARVLLNSGVFGTILAVGPKQILLELSPGVEMTVLKQAIARVANETDEDVFVDSDEFDDDEVGGADSLSTLDLPPLETADEASARQAAQAEAETATVAPQDVDEPVESDRPASSEDDSYRPSSFSTSDPDPESPRPNAN